jgi:ribonuclease D
LRGAEGFTRWDRRPLTEAQVAYARDDARLLLTLGDALEERLAEAGRLAWAREECRALESASDARDPERLYERLPRLGRLKPVQRAVARELVEWREQRARCMDRPAGAVLPDHAVVELARQLPADKAGLERVRGLPHQTLERRSGELLAAVARGSEAEPPPPPPEGARRDPTDAPLVSLAQALVRQRSLDSGIAVELIATQSDLAALVAAIRRGDDGAGSTLLAGWRRDLVGDELLELLAGRRALSIADGRLSVS